MLSALAMAPLQAAPLSRTDAVVVDMPDDHTDSHANGADTASSTLSRPPMVQTTAAPAGNTATVKTASLQMPTAPPDRDIGRSVREVTKPLLAELTHSDVAEAVRALQTGPDSNADSGLGHAGNESDGREPPERKRNWDGTGQRQASDNNISQASERDPVRDRVRASVLLSGLIDEIKPWAAGAVVLYVLGYITKLSLAARRRTVQRRLARRRHHSRNSQHSQHGRP